MSAGALPQTPLGKLTALPQTSYLVYGVGPPGKRKEIGGRRKGRGDEGKGEEVPECPNPELAWGSRRNTVIGFGMYSL